MRHDHTSITIRVNVSELIAALEKNKATHEEDYEKAIVVYYKDLEEKLAEMLQDAQNKGERDDNFFLNLQRPQLESDKYQKYIDMLNMSQEDTIEIGTDEYDKFVNDNWDWVVGAKMLNATYSSRAI